MRYSMTFALPDRPGQLLKVLEPIARFGGNIVSIIHERDKLSDGYVPVSVVVEFPEGFALEQLLEEIRGRGFVVSEVKEVFKVSRMSFMIVGDQPLGWLLEQLGSLKITRIEAEFSSTGQRCVKIELEASEGELEAITQHVEKVCGEKGYLLIKSI